LAEYNYQNFPLDMCHEDFARFAQVLKAGDRAPDGELTDLATGRRARLSNYWERGPLVIEFGSLT
jgi:hypothetical protein